VKRFVNPFEMELTTIDYVLEASYEIDVETSVRATLAKNLCHYHHIYLVEVIETELHKYLHRQKKSKEIYNMRKSFWAYVAYVFDFDEWVGYEDFDGNPFQDLLDLWMGGHIYCKANGRHYIIDKKGKHVLGKKK